MPITASLWGKNWSQKLGQTSDSIESRAESFLKESFNQIPIPACQLSSSSGIRKSMLCKQRSDGPHWHQDSNLHCRGRTDLLRQWPLQTLTSPEDSESWNPDILPLNKPPLSKIGKKNIQAFNNAKQTPHSKHSLFFYHQMKCQRLYKDLSSLH